MTKKLTKAQRHIAYIIMREEVVSDDPFFCNIGKYLGIFDVLGDVSDSFFEYMLPELYAKKPNKNYTANCWFDCERRGIQKRIELLNPCIIETHA